MTNEKKVINTNPTDNIQGENTASNSENNPVTNLDELTEKEAYFYYLKLENDWTESRRKSKLLGAQKKYDLASIEHKKQRQIFSQQDYLAKKWSHFFNYDELTEQTAEQSEELEKVIEVVEEVIPKKDKGKSKEIENEPKQAEKPENNEFIPPFIPFIPSINTEEPKPVEPEAEQAEASSSTQNTEPIEPKELSAESQQIIKLVNEVLISKPTEPSGDQVETIFAPEIKTFPEPKSKIRKALREADRKLFGPVKIDNTNRLYKLKPEQRQELIGKFSGLDKVIAEKLAEKVGTRQESTPWLVADHIAGSIVPAFPILGNIQSIAYMNRFIAQRDNLCIELEKSFSIAEVKEIVRKSNHETHEKLKGVENLLIRIEESKESLITKKNNEIVKITKNATEKEQKQQQEIAELKKQGEKTLEEREAEKEQQTKEKAEIATKLESKEKELKTANDQLTEKKKEPTK